MHPSPSVGFVVVGRGRLERSRMTPKPVGLIAESGIPPLVAVGTFASRSGDLLLPARPSGINLLQPLLRGAP